MTGQAVCRIDEIADPGARGFTVETPQGRRELLVVRQLGHIRAYENSCPHIGTPLNFMPDQLLTRDRRYLLCSTHGALFEPATGLCIHGPCKGQSLKAVPVAIDNGQVVVRPGA